MEAEEIFKQNSSNRKKIILLVSDGEPTYSYAPDIDLSKITSVNSMDEYNKINLDQEVFFITEEEHEVSEWAWNQLTSFYSESESTNLKTNKTKWELGLSWGETIKSNEKRYFKAPYDPLKPLTDKTIGNGNDNAPLFNKLTVREADRIKQNGIQISAVAIDANRTDYANLMDTISSIGEFYKVEESDDIVTCLTETVFKRELMVSEKVEEQFDVYDSEGYFNAAKYVNAQYYKKDDNNNYELIRQKKDFENNTFTFEEAYLEQGDRLEFKYWVILKENYEDGKRHQINYQTEVLQKTPFKKEKEDVEFRNDYQLMVELTKKPEEPAPKEPEAEDPKPIPVPEPQPVPEPKPTLEPQPVPKPEPTPEPQPESPEPTPVPLDDQDVPRFNFDDVIPDPSAPDSPETIVVVDEDGTPKVYKKQKNDDDEEIYVDENGVPLVSTLPLPKTSDISSNRVIEILLFSTGMALILSDKKKIKKIN